MQFTCAINAQMKIVSDMQLFVKVVEEGSFSAAARFYGMIPSSVSRQISGLEHELGARLFNRTTRRQSLTEAGQVYYQHAVRIVADIEEAHLAVNQLSSSPSGHLYVTVESDFAVAFIAPILPKFFKQYPNVQIKLLMSSHALDVVDGAIDVAIRFGKLEDSGLISKKIAESSSVVCASPEYLKASSVPVHPSELINHKCLSFRTAPGKNHWKFQDGDEICDVPIQGPLNADSLTFLKESALVGQGIIMIPSWMVQAEIKTGKLIPLLDGFPLLPSATPIHAIFTHNRHLAPKVRVFIDFLAAELK